MAGKTPYICYDYGAPEAKFTSVGDAPEWSATCQCGNYTNLNAIPSGDIFVAACHNGSSYELYSATWKDNSYMASLGGVGWTSSDSTPWGSAYTYTVANAWLPCK